jgi:hypothetical protein
VDNLSERKPPPKPCRKRLFKKWEIIEKKREKFVWITFKIIHM